MPNQRPARGTEKEKIMELMKLKSGRGIAGEFQFDSLQDVLNFTPRRDTYSYCDGDHKNNLTITAILADGQKVELEEEYHHEDGSNYVPDIDEDAPSIGEQIASKNVTGLIFTRDINNQNEVDEWDEYLPIINPDWTKIRRRVEDALRKNSDVSKLFSVAQKLNVKYY